MNKITLRRGTYYLEYKGKTWAKVLSGILLGIWVVLIVLPAVVGATDPWSFLVGSMFLLPPAALLSFLPGRNWLRRVTAIIDGRDVPGGAWVAVMDSRNERHELVVEQGLAIDLARALSVPKH
ncbi:hypothetical protein [Demequina aurantiaca]|uniref:hypothetical protein n=1 Tax=Demequina aurantiaca TaxID=676200 RepID=UPI003D34B4D3